MRRFCQENEMCEFVSTFNEGNLLSLTLSAASLASCSSFVNQSTLLGRDCPYKSLLRRSTSFHFCTSSEFLNKPRSNQRFDRRRKRPDIRCLSYRCSYYCCCFLSPALLSAWALLSSCTFAWVDRLMLMCSPLI